MATVRKVSEDKCDGVFEDGRGLVAATERQQRGEVR